MASFFALILPPSTYSLDSLLSAPNGSVPQMTAAASLLSVDSLQLYRYIMAGSSTRTASDFPPLSSAPFIAMTDFDSAAGESSPADE